VSEPGPRKEEQEAPLTGPADDAAAPMRLRAEAPRVTRLSRKVLAGIGLLALIVRAGLAASNGEARRHVQGGAVRINDQPVSDERKLIGTGEITADGVIKLSLGKKKHILIRPAA